MLQQLHCRDGAFALRAFANHPESRLGRFLSIRFDILAFGWSGVGDEISAMIFSCFSYGTVPCIGFCMHIPYLLSGFDQRWRHFLFAFITERVEEPVN